MGGGDQTAPPTTGGGGTGGGGIDYSSFFQQIIDVLKGVFGIAGSFGNTDIFTGGTSGFQPYAQSKKVKTATIQNLSTTDALTLLFVSSSPGKVAPIVAGQGTILNPAPTSPLATGQGGGSMKVGNIDLSSMTCVFSTNSSQKMSVYSEY